MPTRFRQRLRFEPSGVANVAVVGVAVVGILSLVAAVMGLYVGKLGAEAELGLTITTVAMARQGVTAR